ncbi:MAG: hypothetical protein IKF38_07280 [Clostridia bacterium]|nr:hypothetical protein [Clostridia bacterium]
MKSEHGDTLMVMIMIAASVIILVVFPLLIMADNETDTVQSNLQTQLNQFTSEIAQKKVLTSDDLGKIVEKISGANTYEVTAQIQKLDENVGKKTTQLNSKVQGENVYITLYDSQIKDKLNASGKIELNSGDTITISARSLNQSTAGQLTGQNANVPEHEARSTQTVP